MGGGGPGAGGPSGTCPGLGRELGFQKGALGWLGLQQTGWEWSGSRQGARAWEMRGRTDRMGLWRKTTPVLIWKISQNSVQVCRPTQELRLAGRALCRSVSLRPPPGRSLPPQSGAPPTACCPCCLGLLPLPPRAFRWLAVPCVVPVMPTLLPLERDLPSQSFCLCLFNHDHPATGWPWDPARCQASQITPSSCVPQIMAPSVGPRH